MSAARAVSAFALLTVLLSAVTSADTPTPASQEQVVKISAKRFEYSPSVIKVKVNTPVVLELTTLDRLHGFAIPDLKIEAEIKPGEVTRVRFVPQKTGTFAFHCNVFCGSGHEDMAGELIVTD
jgi:cytochrome c oxidase subunit II